MARNKQPVARPTIGRHAQDRIGRELRVMYAANMAQALPTQLVALLSAFEEAEVAQRRLQEAVQALRQASTGNLNLAARSAPCLPLSVRAQQALLARSVLRRPPTKQDSRPRKRAVRAAS